MDDKNNNDQQPTQINDNNLSTIQSEQSATIDQIKSPQKQKNKQLITLLAKNKKLQAKYIQLFKQHKMIKKDWGVLTTIIKQIFPNLEDKQMGSYDVNQLKQLWTTMEESTQNKIRNISEECSKNKQIMEKEVQELSEERINKISRESKEKIDAINKEMQSYKKNNKNLTEQIADLDKKFDSKRDEISKLTKQKLKLQHQINQQKLQSFTDELVDKSHDQQKHSVQRNEFLALRQQVEQLMFKRDELQSLLKNAKTAIEKLKQALIQKTQQLQKLTHEKSEMYKNQNEFQIQNELKLSNKQSKECIPSSEDQQKSENVHHLIGDDEYVHREYMKNIFMRYMKSESKGDYAQTQLFLNIILTILKFSARQKSMVNQKRKGWFGLY